MNNLHRSLAPISDAAWSEIEHDARRTFTTHLAGRRVVDTIGPAGSDLAAVGTGHLGEVSNDDGVLIRRRDVQPLMELRVPFTVSRQAVDGVERGSHDSDWDPVKEAAKKIAFAEDAAVFAGNAGVGIVGIGPFSSNPPLEIPSEKSKINDTVAQALTTLRLAGVDGPYSLVMSADLYTVVSEVTDHGYPIRTQLARLLGDGEMVWAPGIEGACLVSTRGGDYELHLGQDLSIGYLSHDADTVELYLQESFTFLPLTTEASVTITS